VIEREKANCIYHEIWLRTIREVKWSIRENIRRLILSLSLTHFLEENLIFELKFCGNKADKNVQQFYRILPSMYPQQQLVWLWYLWPIHQNSDLHSPLRVAIAWMNEWTNLVLHAFHSKQLPESDTCGTAFVLVCLSCTSIFSGPSVLAAGARRYGIWRLLLCLAWRVRTDFLL
jgi:hypothetical protein